MTLIPFLRIELRHNMEVKMTKIERFIFYAVICVLLSQTVKITLGNMGWKLIMQIDLLHFIS